MTSVTVAVCVDAAAPVTETVVAVPKDPEHFVGGGVVDGMPDPKQK